MIGPRVLVTGGTGVVGRPLVSALLAMGKEVVILSRKLIQIIPPLKNVASSMMNMQRPVNAQALPIIKLCGRITIFHS